MEIKTISKLIKKEEMAIHNALMEKAKLIQLINSIELAIAVIKQHIEGERGISEGQYNLRETFYAFEIHSNERVKMLKSEIGINNSKLLELDETIKQLYLEKRKYELYRDKMMEDKSREIERAEQKNFDEIGIIAYANKAGE